MRDGFRRWMISTAALALVLLVSDAARGQQVQEFFGPATVMSTETIQHNATVDSTAGSFEVHTTGAGQTGFNILGGASFTVLPSTFGTFITTAGANAPGIAVSSANHSMSLNDLTITTSGPNSNGIFLERQGENINAATNVTVTTTGPGSSALALTAAGGGQSSTETFINSTLASSQGPVISDTGGTNKSIQLTGSNVTFTGSDPAGQWLSVTNNSTLSITASASELTGAANTGSGSTSNLVLENGTVWKMTANSNVTNLTNNASTIN